MTAAVKNDSEVVLVLAPTANDGAIACSVLASGGLHAKLCSNALELAQEMRQNCGAVLIAQEAIDRNSALILNEAVEKQEAWSDLPLVLITGPQSIIKGELFSKSGNVSLLERPFSRLTLLQTIEVALRSRRRQYQIRDLLVDLKASRDEAERANKAKSQFLANMSHELRTPLNAIVGFSELIDEPDVTETERHEYSATIRRNAHLLTQLIDDILDLSKVEAGKLTTERTNCHLRAIINEVKTVLGQRAREKDVALRFDYAEGVPEFISTDSMRLKQILLNIIGNAIKFTSRGAVTVNILPQHRTADKPANLAFVVTDTGHGIAREHQANLFAPFMQADASITRKFGGTGLGLVLSRRLAEMLGGTVELTSSEPGFGSTFTITTDTVGGDDIAPIAIDPKIYEDPAKLHKVSLNGMRILVAEDSPDSRMLINLMLRGEGADVDLALDGAQAVEHAQGGDYDLVLMDMQMPQMDGLQATAKLRSLGYTKPIIAITAHAMKEERDKALHAGCDDHMSKPLNFRELLRKIKTFNVDAKNRDTDLH